MMYLFQSFHTKLLHSHTIQSFALHIAIVHTDFGWYLLVVTYMRVPGLGFVAELLPVEAAQAWKPIYVISIPYYVAWFFYSCILLRGMAPNVRSIHAWRKELKCKFNECENTWNGAIRQSNTLYLSSYCCFLRKVLSFKTNTCFQSQGAIFTKSSWYSRVSARRGRWCRSARPRANRGIGTPHDPSLIHILVPDERLAEVIVLKFGPVEVRIKTGLINWAGFWIAHGLHVGYLIRIPAILADASDFGNVGAESAVFGRTLDADENTQVPWSPDWSCQSWVTVGAIFVAGLSLGLSQLRLASLIDSLLRLLILHFSSSQLSSLLYRCCSNRAINMTMWYLDDFVKQNFNNV